MVLERAQQAEARHRSRQVARVSNSDLMERPAIVAGGLVSVCHRQQHQNQCRKATAITDRLPEEKQRLPL
jgi:hypothetical protein